MTPIPSPDFCSGDYDISATDLDVVHQGYEPAAVWAMQNEEHFRNALVAMRRDKLTTQEHGVVQALLEQDEHGRWTGLPSEDVDDFAGPLTSENITRCLHMHAYTTFEQRDVIASYLVVVRLMEMGLTVHIHTDWAKLLVRQLMCVALELVQGQSANLSSAESEAVGRIYAWSKIPRQFDAWVDKAAAALIRDPNSVLPSRGMMACLARRSVYYDNYVHAYGLDFKVLLTNLVSIS